MHISLCFSLHDRNITDDEACVDELRMTFRFFASVLVRRAQKVMHSSVDSSYVCLFFFFFKPLFNQEKTIETQSLSLFQGSTYC
jgi:hypothetical protein